MKKLILLFALSACIFGCEKQEEVKPNNTVVESTSQPDNMTEEEFLLLIRSPELLLQ